MEAVGARPSLENVASPVRVDVVVIGAGLGGSASAAALARAGQHVALVDTHAVFPHEFRAEKLGATYMAQFDRLGLAAAARAAATPIDSVDIYRFGRLTSRRREREYGFAYSDLINGLREAMPAGVTFMVGRIAEIVTSDDRQAVHLADGRVVEARLVVVATGLGETVRRRLGIERIEIRKEHSLSLGFFLDRPASEYAFDSLVYYGAGRDRVAYLTLFPIADALRANLFVYRAAGDPWTSAFRRAPGEELLRLMPGLEHACGTVGIAGKVQVRQVDLTSSENHRRAGVVLVGDAFCTTCPAPGVGINRVLTDVERLCNVHAPRWLATPGMPADKIASFYDDPVKRRSDADAMRLSGFARSMSVDTGWIWTARRLRNDLVRGTIARTRSLASPLLMRDES